MSKLHVPRVIEKDQETPFALPEQVELPLHQLVGAVREGLLAFSVGVGLEVMALMMEEELGEIVGPKGKHDPPARRRVTAPRPAAPFSGDARFRSRDRAPVISTARARSSWRPTRISPKRICLARWP